MLWQDIRYALRALRGSPGFAAVAIVSLALGIGANTAIFSLIDEVALKSLPVRHPEDLFEVTKGMEGGMTNPMWEQIRDHQDVFSNIFAYSGAGFNLAPGGEARYVSGDYVSGRFFETLGVGAALGRTIQATDDYRGCPAVAVVSHSFWETEFSLSPAVLGKTISLSRQPFVVIGVLPPGFTGIDIGRATQIYVPLCAETILEGGNSKLDARGYYWIGIIGRKKPGLAESQVRARLKVLAPAVYEATVDPKAKPDSQARYRARTLDVKPASKGLDDNYLRRSYQKALQVLMAIVALVLLIACANVANLLLARGAARQRETAIRMALGAGRARLVRQLLTESLVLSLAGAALGVLFAAWGARLLVRMIDIKMFLELALDWRVLGFTTAVAILTGVLFGLAPAWRGTRAEPQAAMKANARGVIEGGRFSLGKALVVVQAAVSTVLLAGAGLMLATFFKLETLDPGFARGGVLLVAANQVKASYGSDAKGIAEKRMAQFQQFLEKLRAIPGVGSASVSAVVPVGWNAWMGDMNIEGYQPRSRDEDTVHFNLVSSGYFETTGTALVAGRDFTEHDTAGNQPVGIINQAMAKKFFPNTNPLGKHFWDDDDEKAGQRVEIVGIVKDAKYDSLRRDAPPTAYRAWGQTPSPFPGAIFEVRVTGGAPTSILGGVKQAAAEVDPAMTLEIHSYAGLVEESLTRERLLATLSAFFGGLALLLAVIGLYGVMSYNVSRRRNEIGIRMALGAEQARVLRMVMGEAALMIVIGLAIGLGATIGLTRFVASFLYGVKPNDPWTLGIAAVTLATVAVLAGFFPARRASRLDPMAALREE
ncbi:MAG TPA: ABC transporter permease [Bryobacteraceae bacterium]|nr:ABC transporter permease [Bryobacteraceae bacterium]